jgi:hypothetical protein
MERKGRRESRKKGQKNTTPEELESSIFATGKRRLTIRPRSKVVSNAVAGEWNDYSRHFTRPSCPKSKRVFHKIEYKPHNQQLGSDLSKEITFEADSVLRLQGFVNNCVSMRLRRLKKLEDRAE